MKTHCASCGVVGRILPWGMTWCASCRTFSCKQCRSSGLDRCPLCNKTNPHRSGRNSQLASLLSVAILVLFGSASAIDIIKTDNLRMAPVADAGECAPGFHGWAYGRVLSERPVAINGTEIRDIESDDWEWAWERGPLSLVSPGGGANLTVNLENASIEPGTHGPASKLHAGRKVYLANDTIYAFGTVQNGPNGNRRMDAEIIIPDPQALEYQHYRALRAVTGHLPFAVDLGLVDIFIYLAASVFPLRYLATVVLRRRTNERKIREKGGDYPRKAPGNFRVPEGTAWMDNPLLRRNAILLATAFALLITGGGLFFVALGRNVDVHPAVGIMGLVLTIVSGVAFLDTAGGFARLRKRAAVSDKGFEAISLTGRRTGYRWGDIENGYAHEETRILGKWVALFSLNLEMTNGQSIEVEGLSEEMARRIESGIDKATRPGTLAELVKRNFRFMTDPDRKAQLARAIEVLERHEKESRKSGEAGRTS